MELIAKKKNWSKSEKGNSDENKVTENKTLKFAHKLQVPCWALNQTSARETRKNMSERDRYKVRETIDLPIACYWKGWIWSLS